MQKSVDKKEEQEALGRKLKIRSLFARDFFANDDLTVFFANLVCKHVWHITFLPQFSVQRARCARADERERDLPAGENFLCDAGVGTPHYFLPPLRNLRAAGSILPSFTSSL